MRAIRPLAVVFFALTLPLSRGAAQTCQGTAAFQDGRWRAGAFAHENKAVNDIGAGVAYGVPHSVYGVLSVDQLSETQATGIGLNVGYQIHLSDTPFQFCPEVMGHYSTAQGGSLTSTAVGFGGSLGYRFGVTHWFTLVPAAGVSWISTNTSESHVNLAGPAATAQPDNGTSGQVFMAMGLVFNNSFTIVPGLIIPSQNGTTSIFTVGVSINWSNPVSR